MVIVIGFSLVRQTLRPTLPATIGSVSHGQSRLVNLVVLLHLRVSVLFDTFMSAYVLFLLSRPNSSVTE
jgi:hypothetical protein